MSDTPACACAASPRLIFACSGAADVGAVADLAARELTRRGEGKMYCLAGIGGRVEGILLSTRAAASILAIDGCRQNCARRCLEEAGFRDFAHVQLAELNMAKGQSPPDAQRIERVIAAARAAVRP